MGFYCKLDFIGNGVFFKILSGYLCARAATAVYDVGISDE
jgi:hypothetical protein